MARSKNFSRNSDAKKRYDLQRKEQTYKTEKPHIAAVVAAGCATAPATFVASSKPLAPGAYTVLGAPVTGTSSHLLFFGSFGANVARQEEAYARALRKAPGADALIEMSVDYKACRLGILDKLTITVRGTPVKSK